MINGNQKLLGLLLSGVIIMSSSCSEDDPIPMEPDDKNIVELAQSDNRFSSLVAAVQRAGLTDALSADGELTVFAPTDQAFTDAGVTDVNAVAVEDLEGILQYHVVPSEVPSSAVSSGEVTSLVGAPF